MEINPRWGKQIRHDPTALLRSGMFGFVGKQIGDSMGRSASKAAAAAAPGTTPIMSADQQAAGGTGNNANAKKYLLSQNPSAGYGSNSMNTAKSFLLSY